MTRIQIESTGETGELIIEGQAVPCRVWRGTTASGTRCVLFVARIMALDGQCDDLAAELLDVTDHTTLQVAP